MRTVLRFLACILMIYVLAVLPSRAGIGEEVANSEALPTAGEIIRAVAANQTKSVEARKSWLFRQRVLVRLFRGNGKLAREEIRDYEVRPKPETIERELTSLAGKVEIKGELYPYADPKYRTGDIDLDGEIAESFANELMFEEGHRDGLDADFFPLLPDAVKRHEFRLHGREDFRGRDVYRLTFQPGKKGPDGERGRWKGEVLVDVRSMQPLLVTTEQARGVPFAVRALLGSNIKQFGFKLEYAEMEGGVWFPSKYSGEFSLRVLFGYSRKIALSLQNFEFQKAAADSVIHYEGEEAQPSPGAQQRPDSDAKTPIPESVPQSPRVP